MTAATSQSEFEREIVNTRVINAPRELVFTAYTNPDHVAQWWGPNGFSNTFYEFDPTPGGAWRFVMHGPDGVDYKNEVVFVEILKPERIVFDHVSGPHFKATIIFEEQGAGTKITTHQLFESAAVYNSVKSFAPEANEQNFDRLEAHLATMV